MSQTGQSSERDDEQIVEFTAHGIQGRHSMLELKYMSWSAASVALEEIIEYLEELVDLTRVLVGSNSFGYGFLSRPLYEEWESLPVRSEKPEDIQKILEEEDGDLEDSKVQSFGEDELPQRLYDDGPSFANRKRLISAPSADLSDDMMESLVRQSTHGSRHGNIVHRTSSGSSDDMPLSMKRVISRRRSTLSFADRPSDKR